MSSNLSNDLKQLIAFKIDDDKHIITTKKMIKKGESILCVVIEKKSIYMSSYLPEDLTYNEIDVLSIFPLSIFDYNKKTNLFCKIQNLLLEEIKYYKKKYKEEKRSINLLDDSNSVFFHMIIICESIYKNLELLYETFINDEVVSNILKKCK